MDPNHANGQETRSAHEGPGSLLTRRMSARPIHVRGFSPAEWQIDALRAWEGGDSRGPFRGTLEVFTGGGKTLIALMALAEASRLTDNLRATVVVPTEALARQWIAVLQANTDMAPDGISLMGAGGTAGPTDGCVLVAVINTAAKRLPEASIDPTAHMLIIDECHRPARLAFSAFWTSRHDTASGCRLLRTVKSLTRRASPWPTTNRWSARSSARLSSPSGSRMRVARVGFRTTS